MNPSLFSHLRPTTLAAIVADLEGEIDARTLTRSMEVLDAIISAKGALLDKCGSEEAGRLIDAAKEVK